MADAVDANRVLERLRDPSSDGASAKLASLIVDDALARTVGELLDVKLAVAALREGLAAFAASDAAAAWVASAIAEGEKTLAAEKRTVAARLSPSLRAGARDYAMLQVTPPRDVIEKLLDREPIKKLLRAQVVDTLVAFGRKAASPVSDNPIARGIGGLGKFARGPAGKPSAFGALANAVSGEVERQVEKRAADFADTGPGGRAGRGRAQGAGGVGGGGGVRGRRRGARDDGARERGRAVARGRARGPGAEGRRVGEGEGARAGARGGAGRGRTVRGVGRGAAGVAAHAH